MRTVLTPTWAMVIDNKGRRGIKCLVCGGTSWNRHDVENQFCGFCRPNGRFHESAAAAPDRRDWVYAWRDERLVRLGYRAPSLEHLKVQLYRCGSENELLAVLESLKADRARSVVMPATGRVVPIDAFDMVEAGRAFTFESAPNEGQKEGGVQC